MYIYVEGTDLSKVRAKDPDDTFSLFFSEVQALVFLFSLTCRRRILMMRKQPERTSWHRYLNPKLNPKP